MASPSLAARAAILGVPYQPNKRPDPLGVVKAFEALDAKAMATSAGAIVRDTLAGLNAVTNPPAHQMGWVTGDATAANNGIYENAGSPSAPDWQRRADLPHGTIHMINVGAGTADAIVATASLPAPSAPGAALLTVNILADNTGNVTINGKPLRINSGNEISPGGLLAGSIHAFLDLGDHFRLLSDQASAAIVAAAEAQALAASESASEALSDADRAENYAAMLSADKIKFKTVPLLLADALMSYTAGVGLIQVGDGDIIEAGGFRYEVAASGAADHHVETAGGVKLNRLRPAQTGRSATVTVAAADSHEWSKAEADFVCDGVDDQVELRAACDAALIVHNGMDWYSPDPVITFGSRFPCVWYDGTTYHAYYGHASGICHATSPDLRTWTEDVANNPVLAGSESYDNSTIGVPCVWTEDGVWYMLYRGNGQNICLATGTDAVTWTKSGSNPVVTPGFIPIFDPTGVIKIGSTYHLFANNVGGNRQVARFTSTNLTTWALADSCVFSDRRYCSTAFTRGGYYYLLVSKELPVGGAIELWRCPDIKFRPENRELVGTPVYDRTSNSIDTPSIVTDTIERDTFPGDRFDMIWAKREGSNYPGYLVSEPDIDAAIAKCKPPVGGKIVLMPGTFNVKPGVSHPMLSALVAQYGQVIEGNNALIKRVAGAAGFGLVHIGTDSVLENLRIDGNRHEAGEISRALSICTGGIARNIRVDRGLVAVGEHALLEKAVVYDSGVTAYSRSHLHMVKIYKNPAVGLTLYRLQNTADEVEISDRAFLTDVVVEESVLDNILSDLPLTGSRIRVKDAGREGIRLRSTTTGEANDLDDVVVEDSVQSGLNCGVENSRIFNLRGARNYLSASVATHGQVALGAAGCRLDGSKLRESPASGCSLRVISIAGCVSSNNDFDKAISHTAGVLTEYNNIIAGTLVP